MTEAISLVADIGGTNTRVALAENGKVIVESIGKYRNAHFPGLETVLRSYLDSHGHTVCAGACVAVAGPVHDGKATLTNLDWSIDSETLTRATGAAKVSILNDLQAQGHAVGRLDPVNLLPVIGQLPERSEAPRLVIGVGTGFNAAPVHQTAAGRIVPASESGHANLPIRTEADLRLLRRIETIHGFPAVEDVLSGRGLERVYSWLRSEADDPGEMTAADIVAAAEDGEDVMASEAVRTFVRILGTVAGNLSLIHLPFGGVYLVGGVSRHLAPWILSGGFAEAFRDKGRFAGFMANFPVAIVEDDYAALTGAAAHLGDLL